MDHRNVGKTCPFCQFPIKQDSEVIVCRECKVPHHRECWQHNEGCTTFGHQGFREELGSVGSARVSTRRDKIEIDTSDLPMEEDLESRSFLKKESHYVYPKAHVGKRIGAWVIDTLISIAPVLFVSNVLAPIVSIQGSEGTQAYPYYMDLLIFLSFIWIFLYTLFRDGLSGGQSCGKLVFGLMVVRGKDNRFCTFGSSFVRNFLLYYLSIIEIIVPLAQSSGYRLGDMLAKTQVIEVDQYRFL